MAAFPARVSFFKDYSPAAGAEICERFKVPFKFERLIVSPAFILGRGGNAVLSVRIFSGGIAGPWRKTAVFERGRNRSFGAAEDGFCRMETDFFICARGAEEFEFKIKLSGGAKLKRLACSFVKHGSRYVYKNVRARAVNLKIKGVGQDNARVCSPAVITAALNYFGKKVSLNAVKKGVYDNAAKIYGNWLFNTAYAADKKLFSHAVYLNNFEEVFKLLKNNFLVCASIAFNEGELGGAPLKSTPGHLVLIRGFDKDGRALVMDPAARRTARTYDAKEFARAWLKNKNGIAYIIGEL